MQHLEPDRLVLLALSEQQQELSESDHLAQCAGCRVDFEGLREVADIGASAQELRDLPAPPEQLWHAIEAEIARPPEHPAVPPVVDLGERRRRAHRARSSWRAPLIAAAAAAVLAIAGTTVVERYLDRAPAEQVMARATLTPLESVPADAAGSVRVLADGAMRIDVRNLPLTTGFHEVWLIDPDDLTKMVPLGSLADRPDAELPVPPGIDLNRYRLVDVSDEPHDGDATHSGRSLLRGTLTS